MGRVEIRCDGEVSVLEKVSQSVWKWFGDEGRISGKKSVKGAQRVNVDGKGGRRRPRGRRSDGVKALLMECGESESGKRDNEGPQRCRGCANGLATGKLLYYYYHHHHYYYYYYYYYYLFIHLFILLKLLYIL